MKPKSVWICDFKGLNRLGASDGLVKKSKHLEVDVLGNKKELYPMDQAQIKKHGKPPSYLMVKISFFSFPHKSKCISLGVSCE